MPIKVPQFKNFDYTLIGGDVRYAILDGKQNKLLPTVSVGVGFNYLSGALGMTAGSDQKFSYDTGTEAGVISATMEAPEITVGWSTASLDFKAQISKSFVFITPYLGVGVSTGWSKANVDVTMKMENGPELERLKQIFKDGISIGLSDKGFSSESDTINGWSGRLFGGLTFNVAVVRIELTGFYNFIDKYGVTLGFRVQL
jgi:hypothetical protein